MTTYGHTKPSSIRIPEHIKKRAMARAAAENRTLTDVVVEALSKYSGTFMHNATAEHACTECGHWGNGNVPGCTCIGCDK